MTNKVKIMIAVAAAVVILAGGFAAAWFGGALDGVFNRNQTIVSEHTTTEAEKTTTKTEEVTTEASTKDDETTTAQAATTTAATTAAAGGGGVTQAFNRKQSPALASLFKELSVNTHISNDTSPKGAVEETFVNLTNAVFASARNVSSSDPRYGGNVFGLECNIAVDYGDAYARELMAAMFGPYAEEPEVLEIIRLIGSSEFKANFEAGGDIVNEELNIVANINAEWLVKARSFLSANMYFDLEEILFSFPELTSKLFYTESTIVPIPMGDFDAFMSQAAALDGVDKYIEGLMPYIEKMVVAAVSELDVTESGKEELELAGGKATLDTIDVVITDRTMTKAAIAALTVLKDSPEAIDLALIAYNDIATNVPDLPPLDKQSMTLALDGAISQLKDQEEFSYDETLIKLRIYMNDGAFAGIAIASEATADLYGFVAVTGTGYAIWISDMFYSQFDEIKDLPASYKDSGVGNRTEIYGNINNTAGGLSGDLRIKIRDIDETFDGKLLNFSDLGVKVIFGVPVLTGRFTVNMQELYDTFVNADTYIPFVWDMSNAMMDLDETPLLKNLEFSLDLSIGDNKLDVVFGARDTKYNSSASVALSIYSTNKKITAPSGERLDIVNADENTLMQLFLEINSNIEKKIDELTAMGYEVGWLNDAIMSTMASGFGVSGGMGVTDPTLTGGNAIVDPNDVDYLFPLSDEEVLNPEDLIALSPELLRIARNEIYARHGWVFTDLDLQMYFNQKWWYVPLYDNDSIELNYLEALNVEMISAVESYYE